MDFVIGAAVWWLVISVFTLVGEAKGWFMRDWFWFVLALPIVLPFFLVAPVVKFVMFLVRKVKR